MSDPLVLGAMIFTMTVMGAAAALLLKRGVDGDRMVDVVRSPWLWFGGILYLIAAVVNILVLRHLPVSVVLPLTSLTYIWSLLLSVLFLKERTSFRQWLGVTFIGIGATLIALS